jgi:hypothetical protein
MRYTLSAAIGAALVPLALTACASGSGVPPVTPVTLDRSVVTAPELQASRTAHVYEALQRLRPEFLRTRGPSSIMNPTAMGPAVFVDRAFIGGIEVLADMPLIDVQRIRFLGAWDAATTYGEGYSNGVLEITTRRGGQ